MSWFVSNLVHKAEEEFSLSEMTAACFRSVTISENFILKYECLKKQNKTKKTEEEESGFSLHFSVLPCICFDQQVKRVLHELL